MSYNFGNSIVREFYTLQDNDYINLPSQAPAIYLFNEKPSIDAARAGTDAVKTVSYWIEQAYSPFKRQYTITPVDDPAPTSTTKSRGYWEAINYVLSSGQAVTNLREITIERPESHEAVPGTTYIDCTNIFPQISSYLTIAQVETYIALAINHFKLDLKKQGLDWGRVRDLDEIKIPIAYKALALGLRGQVIRRPELAELVDSFNEEYNQKLAGIQVPYDTENDGETVTVEAKPRSMRIAR